MMATQVNGRNRNRRRAVRARCVGGRRQSRLVALALRAVSDLEDAADPLPPRPRTRAGCDDVPRPCPYVSCRYHLYLNVLPSGNLQLCFPDLEPWELEHSCALDEADAGPQTLEEVGARLNVTRERIRQLQEEAYEALRAGPHARRLRRLLSVLEADDDDEEGEP